MGTLPASPRSPSQYEYNNTQYSFIEYRNEIVGIHGLSSRISVVAAVQNDFEDGVYYAITLFNFSRGRQKYPPPLAHARGRP